VQGFFIAAMQDADERSVARKASLKNYSRLHKIICALLQIAEYFSACFAPIVLFAYTQSTSLPFFVVLYNNVFGRRDKTMF